MRSRFGSSVAAGTASIARRDQRVETSSLTDVRIYGELSPEAETLVAAMNPERIGFDGGTFDRRVAVVDPA